MITQSELDQAVTMIDDLLNGLESPDPDLGVCLQLDSLFTYLSDEYQDNGALFDPQKLETLKQQKIRYAAAVNKCLEQIVDRFHALTQQAQAAKDEREKWRDLLINVADSKQAAFSSAHVRVEIKPTEQLALPPGGSSNRQELEELLKAAGKWETVSDLSYARLHRAIQGGDLDEPTRQAVDELCPVVTRFRVRTVELEA